MTEGSLGLSGISSHQRHDNSALYPQLALALPDKGDNGQGPKAAADGTFQAFGSDGFTFRDVLDIVNPLQHIPFVGTLYRDLTGDTIDPGSRVIGGTVFGGPIGAAVAVANVVVSENTGKDMGEHVLGFFGDEDPVDGINASLSPASDPAHEQKALNQHLDVLLWAQQEAAFRAGRTADRLQRKDNPEAERQSEPEVAALSPELGENPAEPSAQTDALSGAIGREGGWYTTAMLQGLQSYNAGLSLNAQAREIATVR